MKVIQSSVTKRAAYEFEDDPEDDVPESDEEDMIIGKVRIHTGKIRRCKSGRKAIQRQKIDYSADAFMKQWIKDQRHKKA